MKPMFSSCVCGIVLFLSFAAGAAASSEADINVRQFGAKGDGVTDDSAAFTAAGNELWKRARPMARPWGHLNREKASGSIEGPRPRIVVPKGAYLLKDIGLLYRDKDGKDVSRDSSGLAFTCPTAEETK